VISGKLSKEAKRVLMQLSVEEPASIKYTGHANLWRTIKECAMEAGPVVADALHTDLPLPLVTAIIAVANFNVKPFPVEFSAPASSDLTAKRKMVRGVMAWASRAQHSCVPNGRCNSVNTPGLYTTVALRPVAEGDMITIR
jgi:hypothetical protein